jgi:hypothetical protein
MVRQPILPRALRVSFLLCSKPNASSLSFVRKHVAARFSFVCEPLLLCSETVCTIKCAGKGE